MRRFIGISVLVIAAFVHAQTKINPANQINWPSCAGGALFYDTVHNICVNAGGVTSFSGDGTIITNSASTGAVTITIAGTSGGIPYFSSSSAWASSAALAAHGVVIGGGAATAPTSTGAGVSGQVLTSNGASSDPTFQTASGGAFPQWNFDDMVSPCCVGMANANSGSGATFGTVAVSAAFGTGVNGIAAVVASTTSNTWSLLASGTTGTSTQSVYLSNSAGSYSWAAKLWASNSTNAENKLIFGSAVSSPNPTLEFGFDCDSTIFGNGHWWAETQGSSSGAVDSGATCVGAWHQLEIKVVNGAITYYVDGSSVTTGTVTVSGVVWYPTILVWTHASSNAATLNIDWTARLNPTGITLQ